MSALMAGFVPSPTAILRAIEAAALAVVAADPPQAVRLALLAAELRQVRQ